MGKYRIHKRLRQYWRFRLPSRLPHLALMATGPSLVLCGCLLLGSGSATAPPPLVQDASGVIDAPGVSTDVKKQAQAPAAAAKAAAAAGTSLQVVKVAAGSTTTPPPGGTTLTVDFRNTTYVLDAYSIGATISTYSGGGSANINRSATWKANLQALGPLAWRVPFRYNGGNPGSSAGGGQSSGDASAYVSSVKAIGGQPVVVVGGDASDNNFTNADAAGLVHYFNDNGGQHGGPVHAWVIGNEYSNSGNDPIGYQAHLNGWAAAMKAADSSITISAPAAPDMKYADGPIAQAVTNAAGFIDYLSYHAYQGASAGLSNTGDYQTYANQYRSRYINGANFGSRASQVAPALEEFNWAPYYTGNSEFYDWHNTIFAASVIGHSLSAGAHAYEYSDSNGALGLMNDGAGNDNQPGGPYTKFPMYWGLGMWTGLNGTFKRFGDHLVTATSAISDVEVYATNNGKILLINKDTSDHAVTVGLGGKTNTGTYNVWQTSKGAPFNAPAQVISNGSFSNATIPITLPAGTVSSVEL